LFEEREEWIVMHVFFIYPILSFQLELNLKAKTKEKTPLLKTKKIMKI